MTILAALVLLLISFTTSASFALARSPELGVDLFAVCAPLLALLFALWQPRGWRAPSALWILALGASHAALRAALHTDPGLDLDATALATGALTTGVGLYLGYATGRRVRRLEDVLRSVVVAPPALQALERSGGEAMLREMRRARRYQRPLSVVSLAPAEPVQREELERLVAEMRRSALDRYTDARLASLLVERLDSSSVVARDKGHFVLLLTETDRTEAQQAVARIEHEFSKELGISVRCGISSFPDEETTLTGLLETSELEMQRSQAWVDSAEGASES